MRPFAIEEFARIVGGEPLGVAESATFAGFSLDSREVPPGSLFIAIRGANVDGHAFAGDALKAGAAACLVERPIDGACVRVPSVVMALARFARHFRERFEGPVVGVTGSVGKTSTKEFLAAALSPLGRVAKTEGNRNTEYTAPLLWPELEGDEAAVVAEMAMRGFGQIAHLTLFSRPTVGVITNIGQAHLETVGSREGIARAKSELFKALPLEGLAVAWAEDDFLAVLRKAAPCPFATFGESEGADARLLERRAMEGGRTWARFRIDGDEIEATIPALGRHMALNAAAALLVGSRLIDRRAVEFWQVVQALGSAKLPPMRMEVRKIGEVTILLDAYNAAPSSFAAALEALAELPCEGRRWVVMGEMKELGAESEAGHREVGRLIAEAGVAGAVFLGEATGWARDEAIRFGMNAASLQVAENLEELRAFLSSREPGDVVLVKGSRAMELERALPKGAQAC